MRAVAAATRGETFDARVDLDRIHVFDAATEERIEA